MSRQLPIRPFTLKECEEYAQYRRLNFSRRQLAECYMALGGVAYYWSLLQEGLSAAQNFDRLFFGVADEMRNEYRRLFSSLFRHPTRHMAIVELLGGRSTGMTREEILEALDDKSGGEVSTCLEELCDCGFLRRYSMPQTVKKGAIYQLVDNYVLFYFKFLKNRRGTDEHFWTLSYSGGKINAWRGLAFERICLWHIPQIRSALGISGVLTDVYSWRARKMSPGDNPMQIDMLLDRSDNMIDICEMKFTDGEYEIDAEESRRLSNRVETFRRQTKTRKGVRLVLVASAGLKHNKYSGDVQSVITLDDLFREYKE